MQEGIVPHKARLRDNERGTLTLFVMMCNGEGKDYQRGYCSTARDGSESRAKIKMSSGLRLVEALSAKRWQKKDDDLSVVASACILDMRLSDL